MRKGVYDASIANTSFSVSAMDDLQKAGFKYFQVKGLTVDNHYEYVEPQMLVLVPFKELPTDPMKKDIYEPIDSELLYRWARETNEFPVIIIADS